MMRSVLLFLFGVVLSIAGVAVGLMLTKMIGSGLFVGIIIVAIPIVGVLVFKTTSKQIGLGLITAGVLLSGLALVVLLASGLH